MKKQFATFAFAAAIGLSAIAPASASMIVPAISTGNAEVIEVGSHSYGGGGHYHRPKRHYHYHCHRRWVHGYWKKVCHKAAHSRWGGHHGHGYH